jgi:pimeloyl-ACP methyl ester carboxylesterase
LKLLSAISKKKAAAKAFELFCTPQPRKSKTAPGIFETAEKLRFSLEGIRLNGWRWNDNETKEPLKRILIIHGFESSAFNFDRYIRPLLKKGYEVLAFDAPAHGKSGGKQITAPLYSKVIREICGRYGPVQSFMAHSFGGLALSLALEEMPHDKSCHAALIAPATETVTAIDSFFKLLQLDPAIRVEFENIIREKGKVEPSWYSISRAMENIRATVLWVHDEEDDTTPINDIEKLRSKNFSNIEFVITKGLGHRRIYRDNAVVKKIVSFL